MVVARGLLLSSGLSLLVVVRIRSVFLFFVAFCVACLLSLSVLGRRRVVLPHVLCFGWASTVAFGSLFATHDLVGFEV